MNWRFWRSAHGADSETCSSLEPLLSLYSDGMASAAETRRVKRHLADCPDCRRSLRWMQATHVVISRRPAALPPPDMQARIARAIAASSPAPVVFQTKPRPVVLRPAVWAAAASLAVMGIVAEHLLQSPEPIRPVAPAVIPPKVAVRPPTGAIPHVSPAKSFAVAKSQSLHVKPRVRALPHPADEAHVALLPPKTVVPARPIHTHASFPLMANLPPTPSDKTLTVKSVLIHHNVLKPTASLVAVRPKPTSNFSGVVKSAHEETAVREAKNTTPPTEEHSSQTAPPAEAAPAPASVQVAVNAEPPTSAEHPTHSGLLDGVRLRVASLNGVGVARKIYRDSSARVMAAAYTTSGEGGKFVMGPIAYSPTSLTNR